MKMIRSKLLAYFSVFVLLFNMVSISIYFSSTRLVKEYHDGYESLLALNQISRLTNQLFETVNIFLEEREVKYVVEFQNIRKDLVNETERLENKMIGADPYQIKKYENMIDTLIQQSELVIGFALRGDIDRYTTHLQEAQNTTFYIKDTTIDLIDVELTEYQNFYQNMNQRNVSFTNFIIFLFITSLLLAIIFALWFSRGINEPIQDLTKVAKEISAGNLEGEDVYIHSNDELKLLGDAFNQMRGNIRLLIKEIQRKSEQEQLLKELELRHLQNQINPHFFFNTLNTISRMAYLEEAQMTTKLIESLSSLFRYSLGDIQKSVYLRDEVKAVHDYFIIQRVRFADRISFTMNIDNSCLDIKVPRLIIQPLVENAFIHGVENMEEGGKISLNIYPQAENVIVEVVDNGAGIDQKVLTKLFERENQENHTGHTTAIGLKNVTRRLQLFFDKADVLSIDSEKGKGTTVRLILPKEAQAQE